MLWWPWTIYNNLGPNLADINVQDPGTKDEKPGQDQMLCGYFLRNWQVSFAADVLFKFNVSKHLVIY